ncbi:MAG: type II secretion system protein [Candidatus Dojkabacteria bacterium]|nr:MAG: type II secretion system protein [Candidatus Dojkabacteria bacterium]
MPRSLPNRVSAFTLMELLVVLAIFGFLLLMTSGMSARVRDTFIAQQQIKNFVQTTRIVRRKSMLVTRNANDNEWVHGIGMQFEKTTVDLKEVWQVRQFKALRKVNSAYQFYIPFPTNSILTLYRCWNVDCTTVSGSGFSTNLLLTPLENTTVQTLPNGMELQITHNLSGGLPSTCSRALTLIYETINGELHAYCSGDSNNPVKLTTTDELLITMKIRYASGANYQYTFNISNSGEINAVLPE